MSEIRVYGGGGGRWPVAGLCAGWVQMMTADISAQQGFKPALEAAALSCPVSSTAFTCRKPKSQRHAASASAMVAA